MSRDLLLIVDVLAREKNVDKDVVFIAVESALASATKRNFRSEVNIRVSVDRETGEYSTFRRWEIVPDDNFDDPSYQIQLSQALLKDPDSTLGSYIEEEIDSVDLGRVGAQAARQVIVQRIRDAEREQILNDFLQRTDKLVSGVIKRIDRVQAIVDCGRIEAVLKRDHMIPKDNLRVGDRVRAYLHRVDYSSRGPQIELSRTAPELVVKLFSLCVPEIEEGTIEIKASVRDPGLRAKIAVKSYDQRIDPIGTCVGIRGSRVQSVTQELVGERIDIIVWSPEPAQFVINALAPAEVTSIVVDEERRSMDVVVDEDNLAVAIGARGQNVRLASELTGWDINLMTLEEKEKKGEEEVVRLRELFVKSLGVDDEVADVFIRSGFITVEEIAYVPVQELLEIPEFDEQIIEDIRSRARNYLLTRAIAVEQKMGSVSEDLLSLDGMDSELLSLLASNDIVDREALAELSVSELVGMIDIDEKRASDLIMKARAHWFN
ncbi:transcription termination factor NusA [Candidatus Ichthyocystis hellenicum]|uniref:transcription termination factor NusA n=1 Tax=Candidatus Ichthyocystis hellenicum TaxID=1561003 RepID=UPI000AE4E194|nr:transcription termination factor NusA [Candidatus Ichthyocystis hellenicum]